MDWLYKNVNQHKSGIIKYLMIASYLMLMLIGVWALIKINIIIILCYASPPAQHHPYY